MTKRISSAVLAAMMFSGVAIGTHFGNKVVKETNKAINRVAKKIRKLFRR